MRDIGMKCQPIKLGNKLDKILKRRKELFKYYRDKSDRYLSYLVLEDGSRRVKQQNLEDEKRIFNNVSTIESLLPRLLINIPHKGSLKILAFSDYRVHDIDVLLEFVQSLKEKPDLIVYAGDDVERFAPMPMDALELPNSSEKYPMELEPATFSLPDSSLRLPGLYGLRGLYGFILRVPKSIDHKDYAKSRILSMIKITYRIYEILKNHEGEITSFKERLIKEFPYLKVIKSKDKIKVVDETTGTKILEIRKSSISGELLPDWESLGYWYLLKYGKVDEVPNLDCIKIAENKGYIYYYVVMDQPKRNFFEELACNARYGLVAVIGNDDEAIARLRIRGEKVYNLHDTWLRIGSFLLIGLEGSTSGLGPSGIYLEGDVKLILELAQGMLRTQQDRLIIISHTPPRGVLDRAMRFGDEAIGSMALRDFLEECDNVTLVICGHVHRCGGKYEKLDNVTVANVSSHDSPFDRANLAWIVLDETGVLEVKMMTLPSPVERIFMKESEGNWLRALQNKAQLSINEAKLFIDAFRKYNKRIFDDLPELASLKFRYGFSWGNVFKLYSYDIKSPDQINESIFKEILNQSHGLDKMHLKRAYAKIRRELEKGKIYLINPIPISADDNIIVFDTEYSEAGVLYGFLDLSSGDLKQFWFNEKKRAMEYLKTKKDSLFVHWGGNDKKLLREELNCNADTLNLLYHFQISFVAPISSTSLRDVHDALCGHKEDEWWKFSFYEMDGLYKFELCNHILRNPDDEKTRKELADANKADLIALGSIIKKLQKLPVLSSD
jgi:Icc-related predicted phosphoesterase